MITEQYSPKESSMIKNLRYNFDSNSLKVEFNNGSIYEYAGVAAELYDDLCKAESVGKFFNEKIKTTYPHSKLITE